jgi:hypothetical protein
MKKKDIFVLFLAILLSLNLISAINLDVKAEPVSNTVIVDLDKPAIFDLTISNLGDSSEFEIYSLVGVDITPEKPFFAEYKKNTKIRINVMPQESLKMRKGMLTFEYEIRNSKKEIQKEQLSIDVNNLEDFFSIIPEDIYINSEKVKIKIKNKAMYGFDDMKIKMNSIFFNYEGSLSLKNFETKAIEVSVDKEKLKRLDAGNYLIQTEIQTEEKTVHKETVIKYSEEENIKTTENKKGLIIQRHEITKENLGNVKKRISISTDKNLISYLFTNVNEEPSFTKFSGFNVKYTWEKDLPPGESFKIAVKTNWLYPLIIIILIVFICILIKRNIEKDFKFRKNVSFVKTRGGEFALRVHLRIKAKRFIEKIKIVDKLPNIVSLYEKYGAIAPDNVDLKNRKLEWHLESLDKGEEKIFSYIVYSKIGVVGRFELPAAKAVYEREGKIKERISNKSFFINKPKSQKM